MVQPLTPKDIVQVIRNPRRFPSPLRPQGSGSSITRCTTASGGTILDMTGMDRVLRIDQDTVTVQPGILVSDLAEILSHEGKELIGGEELADRTIGGAVSSVGLEASIAGNSGNLASSITQLKVISPTGKRFLVTDRTQSLSHLLRLSYGLLGVIYEISLRIRPIQSFTSKTAQVSFENFARLGTRLASAGSGIRLVLYPFTDRIFMELRRPNPGGKAVKSDYTSRARDWALHAALPVIARSLAMALPIRQIRYPLIDNIGSATRRLFTKGRQTESSHSIEQTGQRRGLHLPSFSYCTWAFPVRQFPQVAIEYQAFCSTHYTRTGFRCDMPSVGFRMSQDRSSVLSPSFDGAVVTLSPISTDAPGIEDFIFEFSEFAADKGGIPLFNQTKNAPATSVARAFGHRLALFQKIRREFDPDDRMLNSYFASYMS